MSVLQENQSEDVRKNEIRLNGGRLNRHARKNYSSNRAIPRYSDPDSHAAQRWWCLLRNLPRIEFADLNSFQFFLLSQLATFKVLIIPRVFNRFYFCLLHMVRLCGAFSFYFQILNFKNILGRGSKIGSGDKYRYFVLTSSISDTFWSGLF